jgi:uridine kinase
MSVHVPVYDYGTHSRVSETILVTPRPVIVIEGILIFAVRRSNSSSESVLLTPCKHRMKSL